MYTLISRGFGSCMRHGCGTILAKITDIDVARLSYGVFFLGGLIGTINIVAGVILANLALVFSGIVLVSSNVLALYQAKRFGCLKNLNEQNGVLEKKLSALKDQLAKLEEGSNELKKTEKSTSQIVPEIENMRKEEEKVVFQDKQTIERLEKNLKVAEAKLEKFYKLTLQMQDFANKLGLHIAEKQKSNQMLTSQVEIVEKCAKSLKEQGITIDNQIQILDHETDQMEKIINIYKQHDSLLTETVKLIEKMIEERDKLATRFEETVEKLKKETPKIDQVSQNLENTTHNYALLYEQINLKVNEIKKIKESSEYKEFLEWKNKK